MRKKRHCTLHILPRVQATPGTRVFELKAELALTATAGSSSRAISRRLSSLITETLR
jgi:hypothetical protein